jgi:uncharacterized membrane protein
MLQVLGRLHPLCVHFPIALLLAALLAELVRPRREGPSETAFFCLALGAAGAALAALTGWLFAEHDPPGMEALLLRHRWAGIGAAASACTTLLWAWRWRRTGAAALARPTRLGLALTALLVAASAHLGGSMVYGEGFALEPLRARSPAEEPAAPPPAATGSTPVDYATEIVPLLERRCYECHGNRKRPKGDLRLSDLAAVLARDPSEAALVPGDPEASLVYQRITLPPDHEDAMPPEGGPLAPEEIELVRRWIAEGVRWSAPVAAPADAPEAEAAPAVARFRPEQLAARDAALARLRARGARAERLSHADETVEVDLGVASPRAGDAELAALAGLEPFLVELSLARCAVTDAGLLGLRDFHALRRLRLEHTALTAEGLAALSGLSGLESLVLFGTPLGDEAVPVLARFPGLTRLYTGDTRLGDAALDELARLRPGLSIERGKLPR